MNTASDTRFNDPRAVLEALFKEHFTSLFMYARKTLKDGDISKDIVHNVFAELWEKHESIDFERSLKSYLYTSVHNRCLNEIRNNKKFVRRDSSLEQTKYEMAEDRMEHSSAEEMEQKLQNALQKLPEKCREVFMLSRFENLKYAQIADKQGISVKTVEAQMGKALKILREQLLLPAIGAVACFFGLF